MEPSYKIGLLVVFLVIRHPVLSAEILRNVALGNPVTLSTTVTGYSQNNPSSAVDGKIAQNIDTCGCCASSRNEPNPWLTVDLQEQYMVQKVVVIGRSDYHKEYISRNLQHLQMYNGNHTSTVNIGLQIEMTNNTATARNLDQPFIRRITLKRPKPVNASGEWFLTVCEIEIYVKECTSGTYGDCIQRCGQCKAGTCDKVNGRCPTGCNLGYMGERCDQECTSGTYGDCIQRCGQCKAGTCDKVTGRCPTGCNLGYMGERCNKACVDGYYGNCSQICGNCSEGHPCDRVTGSCPMGCSPGYEGETCHDGYPKNEAADEQSCQMATVLGSVSVCAVAAAVTVIVVVRLMRRKRMLMSSRNESNYEVPVWHAHQDESAYSVLDNTHNLCSLDSTNK